MLKRLHVKNFTVFAEANFEFGPGLNVVVGTNGTGKSHVLKLGYAVARTSNRLKSSRIAKLNLLLDNDQALPKDTWQSQLAEDLLGVFRSVTVGRLASRLQGNSRTEVEVDFDKEKSAKINFSFSTRSKTEVSLEGNTPTKLLPVAPVFIPTKELLSLYPGLQSLYNDYQLSIDLTYPDLCDRLAKPLLNGPKLTQAREMISLLEEMMNGTVKNQQGHFYLIVDGGRFEIDLVAEGIRKIATLAYLLNNGSLSKGTTLFWDEPEANLNPALLKKMAAVLTELGRQGFQIILATHSLFLLNELHILAHNMKSTVRYFGLYQSDAGDTKVEQTDDLETLNHLVALDEEIAQTTRFQRVLDNEDTHAEHP
ncbi:AAA family ATPase [Hymenobacter ruricola]|uniref:AAA family ATPase n=1 Tax=Hymenobacter ruricola TaxID=2791023 RepID=A0ABS0I6E9_9BACT|nr:ATP-binding protein [Hymenobacter ruricola]MBF9222515.1 AAA family ATPase [Hymenobacter ruricola]